MSICVVLLQHATSRQNIKRIIVPGFPSGYLPIQAFKNHRQIPAAPYQNTRHLLERQGVGRGYQSQSQTSVYDVGHQHLQLGFRLSFNLAGRIRQFTLTDGGLISS